MDPAALLEYVATFLRSSENGPANQAAQEVEAVIARARERVAAEHNAERARLAQLELDNWTHDEKIAVVEAYWRSGGRPGFNNHLDYRHRLSRKSEQQCMDRIMKLLTKSQALQQKTPWELLQEKEDMRVKIENLKNQLNCAHYPVAHLDQRFGALDSRVTEMWKDITKEFQHIDGRFEGVEVRFDLTGDSLYDIDKKLDGIVAAINSGKGNK